MSIRRATRRRAVSVPVPLLNDARLSYKAKGLAAYLLAKPETWRVDARALAHMGPDGRDAVLSGLKELELGGYLVRRRWQNDAGQWATESVLYEDPEDAAADCGQVGDLGVTEVGKPGSGSPDPGAPDPISSRRERTTPTPTDETGGAPSAHSGQHANCRACGTNRRASAPPPPEDLAGIAQRRRLELEDQRRSNPCPACNGTRWTEDAAGIVSRCQACSDGVAA